MRALCFCLLLSVPSISLAQDSKDFRKVSCRFLTLDSTTPPPPLLNLGDKGVEVPCTVNTHSLSPASVCHAKGNTLRFVTASDHKPAANATLPETAKACILVFIRAPKTPEGLAWRIFVIEDTAKNLPNGGAFVANFHNADIRFIIGENKILLPPAKSHGFDMPAKRDAFNMAPVVFEFQRNGAWETVRESMLRFVPGMRYLIFAYVDPLSGRPSLATFRDFSTGAKPAPAK